MKCTLFKRSNERPEEGAPVRLTDSFALVPTAKTETAAKEKTLVFGVEQEGVETRKVYRPRKSSVRTGLRLRSPQYLEMILLRFVPGQILFPWSGCEESRESIVLGL
jgi:hypothetical protein